MFDLLPFRHRHRHNVPEVFKEMESFFDKVREKWPAGEFFAETGADWTPRLDITESDKEIKVKADLPGMEPKDIDISLDRDLLIIKGEKSQETEKDDKHVHKIERRYGSFYRAVRLPCEVDPKKIDATFKKGVLRVVLAKAEEAQKRITRIKVG